MKRVVESFISGGIPGSILLIILWKISPAVSAFKDQVVASIRKLEEAVDRRNYADLLRLTANPLISDTLKDAARDVIREIDEATKAREKLTDTKPSDTKVTP